HLLHRGRVGPEPVAPVNHEDPLGDALEVHRPVERRVATAHEQHALPGEDPGFEDAVVQPLPVPAAYVFERQLARREGADPPRDEHGARRVLVGLGDDGEGRFAVLRLALQADHLLSEMDRGLELERLLGHPLHEVLGEHLGEAGDVEDVLLGIERRELPAHLVEVVDQAAGRAAHPGVEGGEQARRAGADYGDIFDVLHWGERNGTSGEKGEGRGERGRRMKIYTKTGDAGETGLFGGGRVPKDDSRVRAYGDVDELNATLGFAAALEPEDFEAATFQTIQRDLFSIGAELATPNPAKLRAAVTSDQVSALEQVIDRYDATLPPLKNFILPGGTPKAASVHLARTTCRRAERAVVTLAREQQ